MPTYKDPKTGKWNCQFYYTDWDGKRRHKHKRGFEKKKDADNYERSFNSFSNQELKMKDLMDDYLEYLDTSLALKNIKPSTHRTKKKYVQLYIYDYFVNAVASNIKPKDISMWLSKIQVMKKKPLAENSRYYQDLGLDAEKDRKTTLASRTLNIAKNQLGQIFRYGIANHGLTDDPTKGAAKIKFSTSDRRAKLWTIEQYQLFYDALDNEAYRAFYNTLYWAGLRIGEALALTANDIVPYKLNIDKNYVTFDGEEFLLTPKTDSSKRQVEIPRQLYHQLQDYISRLYDYKPTHPIFNLNEQTMRNHLNIRAVQLGLPIISPHILRHSYASMLYNQSKNIVVVANQIGHSNPNTTYKFYAHTIPGEDRTAVDDLEKLQKKSSGNNEIIIETEAVNPF